MHRRKRKHHPLPVLPVGRPAIVLAVDCTPEGAAGLELLARRVRERGGYERVAVVPLGASLEEAVTGAVQAGFEQVIVVAAGLAVGDGNGSQAALTSAVDRLRARLSGVEITLAGPLLDLDGYADLILRQVHQCDRTHRPDAALEATLESLPVGSAGRVRDLHGGHEFLARMAALGFTPNAEVTMVQNFGHGPVIVSVRGTRIALGRGEAGRVHLWREKHR